jgi:hypothetical protein
MRKMVGYVKVVVVMVRRLLGMWENMPVEAKAKPALTSTLAIERGSWRFVGTRCRLGSLVVRKSLVVVFLAASHYCLGDV